MFFFCFFGTVLQLIKGKVLRCLVPGICVATLGVSLKTFADDQVTKAGRGEKENHSTSS